MGAKESAKAKSTGQQKRGDMKRDDAVLLEVLQTGKKASKAAAGYHLQRDKVRNSCVKCKFNLGDEARCHVVAGAIDNERGISDLYSPKGRGMLPGDIVWEFVKQAGQKLRYSRGHVIEKGAKGFQCRDCKYYLYSGRCLIIKGRFRPEMSCGYVVKTENGTEV